MKKQNINNPIRVALKHSALALAVGLGLGVSSADATTASVTGPWNDTATWGGAPVPTNADPVTINSGITVTVPAGVAAECTDLTLGGSSHTANVTLILADATSSLAASGIVLVGRANASNIITAINVGAGTFSAGSLVLGNTSATNGSSRKTDLLISTGTATVTGNLTTYADAARITFSGAGTLNLGGSFAWTTSVPTFTPATGTVNYNGAGAQTVPAYAYYNLTLSGGDAKSLATGTSVTGKLMIAPTGSAYASVANGANLSVNILSLGGVGASNGTWGSATGGSGASHTSDTYFGTTTSGVLTVTVDSPTACDILTFGPGGVINQGAQTIVWKVPPGTNLATLAPTYTLSPTGATCPQPNPGIPTPNFSAGPVHYIVTAQNTITTKDYTVTIEYSPLPVWGGLTCWFDASDGVTTTGGGGQVTAWNDLSGNGHHGSPSGAPVLASNQANSKPAVQFRGSYLNCAGTFFSKEQYVVVRCPTPAWTGYGAFLGRASGRGSSYMLDPNGSAYTGFWADQSPDAVSKNGTAVTKGTDGNHIYSLGPLGIIQNYMILKIIVNNNAPTAAAYRIANADGNTLPCDIAEIISYDTTLSPADEAAVGSYLADKYAITSAYPLLHAPAAPAALAAEPLLHSIRLTWTASWSATDYKVYRGTAPGVYDPTPVAATTGGATLFTDTGGALVDGTPYYYVVRAVNSIGEGAPSNEASAAPTAGKVNQTITFGPLSPKTFGDAPFALTATASSLLPVSYASSDELVASISGSTVTILKAGTVTITASQAGDDSFNPAPTVDQELSVSKANQTVTFTAGLNLVKGSGAAPFSDPATSSGGSGNPVTYSSSNEGVATVNASGLVTLVGVGTTEIRADQLGDADHYNAAPQVAQTLNVIATSLPVQDGLACWFDAGSGITEDGSGVASWGDSSTLGHLATRAGGAPTLVPNDINGRPAVHLRGTSTFFNCAGGMFAKEQYLIVRSPNTTWNGSGSFLGRKSDTFLAVRASSYNMANGTDGFWQDHFPTAVSKNGTALPMNNVGGSAFHLAPITDYMLLKITVDADASAANRAAYPYYQIGKNETLGTMDFDVAEIIAFDRALSPAEETLMNDYLTNKYWGSGDPFTNWINGLDWSAFTSPDLTPTGDPDGDGMNNQQEYAFGLDPRSGTSCNPITVPLNKATGTFSYTRRESPATTGLAYTVWHSTNLVDWDSGSATEGSVTTDAGIETVPVTLDYGLLGAAKLFVRVTAQ